MTIWIREGFRELIVWVFFNIESHNRPNINTYPKIHTFLAPLKCDYHAWGKNFLFFITIFWMKSAPVSNTRYRRKVVLSMNKVPFITKAKNLSWSSWWDIFAGYPRLAIDSFFSRFKEKSSIEVTKIKAQQWPDFSFSTTLTFRMLSKQNKFKLLKLKFQLTIFLVVFVKNFSDMDTSRTYFSPILAMIIIMMFSYLKAQVFF